MFTGLHGFVESRFAICRGSPTAPKERMDKVSEGIFGGIMVFRIPSRFSMREAFLYEFVQEKKADAAIRYSIK